VKAGNFMVTEVEKSISILMRSILKEIETGDKVNDTEDLRKVLSLLETFISWELKKKYIEWKHESLDGIYISLITKSCPNQISFTGFCILTSEQCLIPIQGHIKISDSLDEIDWMDCKLAQLGENGITKIPYESNQWRKQLNTLDFELINWHYSIYYEKERL
jgi:hypothetical protein